MLNPFSRKSAKKIKKGKIQSEMLLSVFEKKCLKIENNILCRAGFLFSCFKHSHNISKLSFSFSKCVFIHKTNSNSEKTRVQETVF